MKTCVLKKDWQESITTRGRSSRVVVWRILNDAGVELVQPACKSKVEARALAHSLGYEITSEGE